MQEAVVYQVMICITEDDNDDDDDAGIGDGDDGDNSDHDPGCTVSTVTNWTVCQCYQVTTYIELAIN